MTTEMISFSRSAGLSDRAGGRWRLSVARLEGPAPFSSLRGVQRTFVPVDGAVGLTINGAATHVAEGEMVRFSGDDEVQVTTVSHPCHALNLMVADVSGNAVTLQRVETAGAVAAISMSDSRYGALFDVYRRATGESRAGEPSGEPLPTAVLVVAR